MDKRAAGLLLLRIGLGGVFLWFGIDKFFHGSAWQHYIPGWFPMLIPAPTFIFLLGVVETIVGAFVLFGLFTRIAAVVAALMLIPIIISLGYNEIGVRDFGLLFLALGVSVLGSGDYSLDAKFFKR
jgi:uncharacterized membrane protein YphA (DoxX/SURF4 family)